MYGSTSGAAKRRGGGHGYTGVAEDPFSNASTVRQEAVGQSGPPKIGSTIPQSKRFPKAGKQISLTFKQSDWHMDTKVSESREGKRREKEKDDER